MRKIYAFYCLNFLINSIALCESFNAGKSKGKEKTSQYFFIYLFNGQLSSN